ncbi:MAG: transcription factor S [Candidatus Baldrarchaeia archaeon]
MYIHLFGGDLMEFCPKCGALLMPDVDEEGKTVLRCKSCGYVKKVDKSEIEGEYRIAHHIAHGPRDEMVVVKEEVRTLPIARVKCPKCSNDRAYYWQLQTRRADEAMTTFYKCTKCGHTWRRY